MSDTSSIPLLQLALDYVSLPPAIAMAVQCAPHVDVLEVGTPLCKAAGIEAVAAIKEVCPDKLVLADLKTPDVGGLEAQMAFDAGADLMTVIGGAALATVESALDVANAMGKEMMMEMTGVRDIVARAQEWKQIGVQRLVYHRGWDEQAFNRQWGDDDLLVIRQLIDMGFKVTVTGGLTPQFMPFFEGMPVSIVICGRGIREAPDPTAAALEMRSALARVWGGGSLSPMSYGSGNRDAALTAATRAVRVGLGGMGLGVTVGGRSYAQFDEAPAVDDETVTVIHCPAGVNVGQIVQAVKESSGSSAAVGLVADSRDAFFLDPAQLTGLGSSQVANLLIATGNALYQAGCEVNVNAGVSQANRALAGQ